MISITLYPYKTVCLNIKKKKDKFIITDKLELESYLDAFSLSDEDRLYMLFSEIERYFKEKQSILYFVIPDHQFRKVLFDNYTKQNDSAEEIKQWISENKNFDINLNEYYYSLPMHISSQSTNIKTLYVIDKSTVDFLLDMIKRTNNILVSLEPLSYAALRGNCDFKNESTFIEIDNEYTEAVSFETNTGIFKNTMPELAGRTLLESKSPEYDVHQGIANIDLSCRDNFEDINGSSFFIFADDKYKKYLSSDEINIRKGIINLEAIGKYVNSYIEIDIDSLPGIGTILQIISAEDKSFFEPKCHVADFYSANILPEDAISINKILSYQLKLKKILKISMAASALLFALGFFVNMIFSADTIPQSLTNDFKTAKNKIAVIKEEEDLISKAHTESEDIPTLLNKIVSLKPANNQLGLTKISIGNKGKSNNKNNDWINLSVRAANPMVCKDYMDSLATVDEFADVSIVQINNNTNGGKNAKYQISKFGVNDKKKGEK